jgi:hypothetical protein
LHEGWKKKRGCAGKIRMTKSETGKGDAMANPPGFVIRISTFGFLSSFVLRISGFAALLRA